jgi:putative transposase
MGGTYTNLLFHIVFSTKGRRPYITTAIEEELYRYLGGTIRNLQGTLLEAGGMPDHVHLLAKLKPIHRLSDFMREVKANSSGWLGERVPRFAWQDGYSAFSVSESQVDSVRGYLRRQKDHHRERDFKEELEALFERHGVMFDRERLWQ